MMKRLISSETRTITGAALILGAASFLSRIIGVVRDRILAHEFGAGTALDVYTAAFRIPDFLYNIIIVGALSAGFIPIFLEIFNKDKQKAWKFTSNVLTITFLGLSTFSLIAFFVLPFFIHLLVPGFSPEAQAQTLTLTRIMLLSPLFLGLSGVVSSILQSLRSFVMYSLAPLFYNLGIIFGAIFLVPSFGLKGLAYGVVCGAFLHFAIQIPVLFLYDFKFSPVFSLRNADIKKLLGLMVPRTLTLATIQITVFVTTFFASTLTAGSIAVFNFANNIISLPIGIIGISFALAAFPTLSELAAKNDKEEFEKHLLNTTRQILFFIIPLTIVFIFLRAQIVRVLLGSGQFNWEDTITTASTVGMFALALFAQCLIPLYTRAFYAYQDTKTPFVRATLSLVLTAGLSFLFKERLGVAGLALAVSLASIIELILLMISLKKIARTLEAKNLFFSSLRLVVAALPMAVVIQILKVPLSHVFSLDTFIGVLLQGVICGVVGLLVYAVFCVLLKVEEMNILLTTLRKRWLKITDVPVEVEEIK